MKNFLELSRIKGQQFIEDTKDHLIEKYSQSRKIFSYASSYGQILLVVQNLFKNFYFYLNNVASEKNIDKAVLKENIYGIARLTGHDPDTAKSSIGSITISWDDTKNVDVSLPLYIINSSEITQIENNLKFTLCLSKDFELLGGDNGSSKLECKIIQGRTGKKEFTGSGKNLQSFNINEQNLSIDKSTIEVEVNGIKYTTYESIYDIPFNSRGCMVKTGINGGIDVYFGNAPYQVIPELGSTISIDYVITDGLLGNLSDTAFSTLRFSEEGVDGEGNLIDLNNYLKIEFKSRPMLGSDSEPVELTRLIAPMYGKSTIIHDKNTLKYELLKMNVFSTISIENDPLLPNTYNIFVTPKLNNRFINNNSYFNADVDKFIHTSTELKRIENHLYSMGKMSTSMSIRMKPPTIKKYALYIILNLFDQVAGSPLDERRVKSEIINQIEAFLLNNNKKRIAISDMIAIGENVDFVDSLRIMAVGEENEANRRLGNSDIIGFDNTGDIEVDDRSIPVIRGGWSDRDSNYYEDKVSIDSDSHSIINIIINKIIKS